MKVVSAFNAKPANLRERQAGRTAGSTSLKPPIPVNMLAGDPLHQLAHTDAADFLVPQVEMVVHTKT